MKRSIGIGLTLLLLCVATAVRADSPEAGDDVPAAADEAGAKQGVWPRHPKLHLFWENDGGPLKVNNATDRHYTNGFGFLLTFHPKWADAIALRDWLGGGKTAVGVHVTHLMFTPEDITTPTLITTDRPYAAFLGGGIFWQHQLDNRLDHLQFDIGVVGPAAQGEEIQTWVHEVVDDAEPMGWDNQIDDEFVFQFYLRRKWRFDLFDAGQMPMKLQAQVIPMIEGAAGFVYVHAEGGATLRIGFNLPDDFGQGRLQDFPSATGASKPGVSLYFFARGAGRVVAHNIFLDGNVTRDSLHTVDSETFVAQGQLGIVLIYHSEHAHVEASYSQTWLTDSFDIQTTNDSFGALTLTLWFDY